MSTPSNPGWATGYVPSSAEWNATWSGKADYPVPVSQGGTGLIGTPANGQLLIGNGATYTAALLTAGSNITITNSSGGITIAASGSAEVYPGAGIANSTGTAWGTSYTTTGTGTVLALATGATLVTPTLGVATATSLNGMTISATTGTLTLANGSTLATSSAFSTTLNATATTVATLPAGTVTIAALGTAQAWTAAQTFGLVLPTTAATTSASTITPTAGSTNQYNVTALAAAATIAAPSGSPVDGQKLTLRFKDNGTARALTWTTTSGAYRAVGVTLPVTTVISRVLYVACIYNAQDSFWDVVAVAEQ